MLTSRSQATSQFLCWCKDSQSKLKQVTVQTTSKLSPTCGGHCFTTKLSLEDQGISFMWQDT